MSTQLVDIALTSGTKVQLPSPHQVSEDYPQHMTARVHWEERWFGCLPFL